MASLYESDSENFDGFSDGDLPDTDAESDVEVSSVSSEGSGDEGSNEDEDEDIDINTYKPEWTNKFESFTVPGCRALYGPNLPADFDRNVATPLDYFQLYFTDALFSEIVTNTNNYAQFQIANSVSKNAQFVDVHWPRDGSKNIDMQELKAYFGLLVFFGLNHVPKYKHYWSSSPFLGSPGVKSVFPCKRFEKITQFIHVSDRTAECAKGTVGYDPLFKIRPVLEACAESFLEYSAPYHHQTIDEAMVKFAGRCSYVQFLPAKPIRRGIKVWVRSDSDSGYANEFEVYIGKKMSGRPSKSGLYFDIVDRLTQKIRYMDFQLYIDNLFNGIPILLHLQQNSILCCGTLRKGRKHIAPAVRYFSKRSPRGAHITMQDAKNRNLTVTAWKDCKVVRFASTLSQPDIITNVQRRISSNVVNLSQPVIAQHYSRSMQGVDRWDHLRSSYGIGRASKKVWRYMLHFFINAALVNAWILYQKCSLRTLPKKAYCQLDFRHELGLNLIGGFSARCRVRTAQPQYLTFGVVVNAMNHDNVHMNAKRARQCIGHKKFKPNGKTRHETVYGCQTCHIHLCKQCHWLFHQ